MDLRICKQCGRETVEDSSFFSMLKKKSCPTCGGNDFIISPAPSNYGKEDKTPSRGKISVVFKVLILIFASIGLIFLCMFLYYFIVFFIEFT